MKDAPPSCDIINTFRIGLSVNFSTRINPFVILYYNIMRYICIHFEIVKEFVSLFYYMECSENINTIYKDRGIFAQLVYDMLMRQI